MESLYNNKHVDAVASPTPTRGAYQLRAHTVCSLERPLVQKVVIAPISAFLVLLVCMVHIEESEMITCSSQPACDKVQTAQVFHDASTE